MASQNSSVPLPPVPDTLCPFLDTIYRGSSNVTSSSNAVTDTKTPDHLVDDYWLLKEAVPQGTPDSEQSICEAYVRFIVALTGQDEVAFELVSSVNHTTYLAEIASAPAFQMTQSLFRKSVSLQIVDAASIETAKLDFGLRLLREGDVPRDDHTFEKVRELETALEYDY